MLELLPIFMFLALIPALFSGFPVAFILGSIGLFFWAIAVLAGAENPQSFFLVVSRIFGGVVSKNILVAIPMFIFMGTMLEKSGIARRLLTIFQKMTNKTPGGLALSVTLMGVVLAATTGIIGASVVMMTLMALPVMQEHGYDARLSTGTIAASGTLGILLPPSIMLVVMADLLAVSAGALFKAAIIPSLLLALGYLIYISQLAWRRPSVAPPADDNIAPLTIKEFVSGFAPPVLLIAIVLGSIFGGLATPTEASGIGAFGAMLLALFSGRLSVRSLQEVLEATALTSAMIFGLFVGATAFSYVFALLGGHDLILSTIQVTGAGPWFVIGLLMLVVFILGFFFDWIEITLIILPVFGPVITGLDLSSHIGTASPVAVWFAIIMAVNLQTSFLTPPFGFALFYLKGAAGSVVDIKDIYRGIIPFVLIQLLGLAAIIIWPGIALFLPSLG